jgi:hypothetical protein
MSANGNRLPGEGQAAGDFDDTLDPHPSAAVAARRILDADGIPLPPVQTRWPVKGAPRRATPSWVRWVLAGSKP